jgi:hypothetical protein
VWIGATTLGTIAQAVIQTDKKDPLMKQEVEHFVHIISAIAFSIGAIFFICALLMKYTFVEAVNWFEVWILSSPISKEKILPECERGLSKPTRFAPWG